MLELSKNIHPNSDLRHSLEYLQDSLSKLFNNENDWSYIIKLSFDDMPKLFDILEK